MPFLQLRDSRYPLRSGANQIGWGVGVDVRLPDTAGAVRAPVVLLLLSEQAASATAVMEGALASLNGVALSSHPAPLLHGDRLTVAGNDLRFGDEGLLGETISLPTDDVAIATPSATAATSRTGGRLISQTDGREYPVLHTGLTLGREATCDVVMTRPDISRAHMSIRPTADGYRLLDTSTNGVFVNGARVMTEVALGRGDTIRVGVEEFRFHAVHTDSAGPVAAVPALAATGSFAAMKRPTPELGTRVIAAPPPQSDDRSRLGTLEIINEGPSKGARFEIRSPRVDIGRGAHNDLVIVDESVSESHAKLQRRDDGWFLADLGSTNGTYVGGERLSEDVRIIAGSEVRFGGVKMVFVPLASVARPSGETRVIVGIRGPDPKRAAARLQELADHASSEAPHPRSHAVPLLRWFAILAFIALVVWAITCAGKL